MLLLLGAYLAYESRGMTFGTITHPGAGFFPLILSVLLIGASGMVLFRALRQDTSDQQVIFEARAAYILVTVLSVGAYVLILESLGFLLSTFVLIVGLMVGIGKLHWFKAALYAGIGSIAVYLVFTSLGIPLPQGILAW